VQPQGGAAAASGAAAQQQQAAPAGAARGAAGLLQQRSAAARRWVRGAARAGRVRRRPALPALRGAGQPRPARLCPRRRVSDGGRRDPYAFPAGGTTPSTSRDSQQGQSLSQGQSSQQLQRGNPFSALKPKPGAAGGKGGVLSLFEGI
jgi:hypothetical protein